jgi:ABC-2 type transport system ATP-binding protein
VPAVAIEGLVVRFGAHTAVDGVTFDAEAGQVTALLGPNGAGKTTTVETTEGYRAPDAGSVRVLGLDPVRDHAALVPRIGVMPQEGGVYPGIRVGEALRLFASYYDDPLDPLALLERVGLSDRTGATTRSLSGGERQRLSLALALVGRPEVAFLDEPTAGVDVAGRQVIRQVIRDLRADGVAVVLTTHELAEAEQVADHVVIVDHGRVLSSGSLTDLLAGDGDEIRFGAPPGLDVASLGAALGHTVSERAAGEYVVAGAPSPTTVAALTAWLAAHDLPLADLRAGRQSLEDVFLRLTASTEGQEPA